MCQQDKLTSVLRDFARTLVTDFPIQGILDHLVQRIVDVLPVTGAGVTLISRYRSTGRPPMTQRCGSSASRPSWGRGRA